MKAKDIWKGVCKTVNDNCEDADDLERAINIACDLHFVSYDMVIRCLMIEAKETK